MAWAASRGVVSAQVRLCAVLTILRDPALHPHTDTPLPPLHPVRTTLCIPGALTVRQHDLWAGLLARCSEPLLSRLFTVLAPHGGFFLFSFRWFGVYSPAGAHPSWLAVLAKKNSGVSAGSTHSQRLWCQRRREAITLHRCACRLSNAWAFVTPREILVMQKLGFHLAWLCASGSVYPGGRR